MKKTINYNDIYSRLENLDIFDSVKVLDIIDSSNTYAKNIAREYDRAIVIAKAQTSGRGRVGRVWLSDFDGCLMFSVLLKPNLSLDMLSFLSQIAAKSLHQSLAHHIKKDATLTIKWPNDIMLGGKKISGILTESVIDNVNRPVVVVGIGLNLFGRLPDELAEIASTIEAETSYRIDTVDFVERFVLDFFREVSLYEQLKAVDTRLIDYINSVFYLADKEVEVDGVRAICRGIDFRGNILIGDSVISSGIVEENRQ